MDKREEKALREQLATYKTEFAKLLYEHQKGLFERGESHYDPDKDRKAPSRFEGVLCQGGRSNRRERQLQKAMGQMVDPAEWIPPENENAGRDALSIARKVMAHETAGTISLWVLKGCKAGKPC